MLTVALADEVMGVGCGGRICSDDVEGKPLSLGLAMDTSSFPWVKLPLQNEQAMCRT